MFLLLRLGSLWPLKIAKPFIIAAAQYYFIQAPIYLGRYLFWIEKSATLKIGNLFSFFFISFCGCRFLRAAAIILCRLLFLCLLPFVFSRQKIILPAIRRRIFIFGRFIFFCCFLLWPKIKAPAWEKLAAIILLFSADSFSFCVFCVGRK